MPGQDLFLTLAEVAIALAGFASIVTALRGRSAQRWAPHHVRRLRSLLAASIGLMAQSLLPVALYVGGLDLATVWVCSSLVLAIGFAYAIYHSNVGSFARDVYSHRRSSFRWPGMALNALLLLTQVVNVFDVLELRGPGPYLIGLGGAMFLAVVLFLQLMVGVLTDGEPTPPSA